MQPIVKKKKRNNKNLAQITMLLGALITLLALLIIPLPGKWFLYTTETGVVGDTIGGIAGPILNFTGLIIVYFSLKEQFKANKKQTKQIKQEAKRGRNEKFFELTFQIVEKFIALVSRHEQMFEMLPKLNRKLDEKGNIHSRASEDIIKQEDELVNYSRIFQDFDEYLALVSSRLRSNELTGEQKLVLINLIELSYSRKLNLCRVGYQEQYNNMFEISETRKDERPPMLQHLDERIGDICRLRQDAENLAATERL